MTWFGHDRDDTSENEAMSDDNKKAPPDKKVVLGRDGKPIPQHIIDRVQGKSREEVAALINQNSGKRS